MSDLLDAARTLVASSGQTLDLIGSPPADESGFVTMTPIQRTATTALLKQFEQLEGALNGLFRAILRTMGVRLKGLYALDIGNRMAELDVLDEPVRWVAAVKLRNELVHEYPLGAGGRYDRFLEAHSAFPFLFDAAARADRLIRDRCMLDPQP